jgi:hypothetical protein
MRRLKMSPAHQGTLRQEMYAAQGPDVAAPSPGEGFRRLRLMLRRPRQTKTPVTMSRMKVRTGTGYIRTGMRVQHGLELHPVLACSKIAL